MIVWGSKSRQEDGGVVGDWCDVCRAPNYHRIIHIYKVAHLYYIPMGSGMYVGSNRQCMQCGTTSSCNVGAYQCVLSHQDAMGRTNEQIMEATNPALMEQIQRQRSLENTVAQRMAQTVVPPLGSEPFTPGAGQADQRMLAALQTLRPFDVRDRDVALFMGRLQKWDFLSVSEREVLLHEIDSFVVDDQRYHATIHFMRTLSSPIPGWLNCGGCVVGLVAFIVGFATVPFLQSWLWGSLFVVFMISFWYFGNIKSNEKAVRVWVNRVLITKALQQEVDLRYFVNLLRGIKGSRGSYEAKISTMTAYLDVISDELLKRGYLTQADEASSAASSRQ